ncbi:MAG: putative glycan acetyltransferase, partial [Massilia sp.]|nr:putative glycan acetyltransferase [Massilia sp.]
NNVTIGAHSVILSGVTIGDNAIVAANSLVSKGTQINSDEVWGGSPARHLR